MGMRIGDRVRMSFFYRFEGVFRGRSEVSVYCGEDLIILE